MNRIDMILVIKVKDPNYRPEYLTVRSEMGGDVFTADIEPENLHLLQTDPGVQCTSLKQDKRLPLIKQVTTEKE